MAGVVVIWFEVDVHCYAQRSSNKMQACRRTNNPDFQRQAAVGTVPHAENIVTLSIHSHRGRLYH